MVEPPKSQQFDPAKLPFFSRESIVKTPYQDDFYKFAVEVAADEVFLMKSDSQIVYVNHSACEQLGYRQEELVGMFVWEWDPLFPKEAWPGFWQEFVNSKHLHFETQHRKKSGQVFPVEIHAHYFKHNDQEYLLALVNDLTERKKSEQLIYKQANYDHLTHLANRYLLMDRLEHAILNAQRTQQQVAVIFIDLDKFKEINDTLGHDAGDQVLVEAAQRLTDNVRESDTIGRLGGDEFVIVMENFTKQNLDAVVEKLSAVFRQPFYIDTAPWRVTISIGVAMFPEHADNKTDLLKYADIAMYKVKQKGRDAWCFYSESPQHPSS